MKEEYRDIKGFEGLYQVSNLGNVKSLNYRRTGKEEILKAGDNGDGYLQVVLCKGGKDKTCTVHRLVAEAFLENTNNLPEVNHKDEDKTNNNVQNLEWCSSKYNCNHGTRNRRVAEANTNNPKSSIAVICISKISGLITEFPSTAEAERITGIDHSNIAKCCNGKRKSCGGYYWMYKD